MSTDLVTDSSPTDPPNAPQLGGPQIGDAFDAANEAKKQDLRSMKVKATALLLAATAIFVACRLLDAQGVWGYV